MQSNGGASAGAGAGAGGSSGATQSHSKLVLPPFGPTSKPDSWPFSHSAIQLDGSSARTEVPNGGHPPPTIALSLSVPRIILRASKGEQSVGPRRHTTPPASGWSVGFRVAPRRAPHSL